jgi:hypothetical protein
MKFKTDSDRHAWRHYAASAIEGFVHSAAIRLVPGGMLLEDRMASDWVHMVARDAALLADAMLEEERKRRPR